MSEAPLSLFSFAIYVLLTMLTVTGVQLKIRNKEKKMAHKRPYTYQGIDSDMSRRSASATIILLRLLGCYLLRV